MGAPPSEKVEADWTHDLLAALKEVGEGDTRVLDADVTVTADDVEDAPQHVSVLLYLPRPASPDGWDVAKTQLVKRQARDLALRMTAGRVHVFAGLPTVSLTTTKALRKDVAEVERPEDGEGAAVELDA